MNKEHPIKDVRRAAVPLVLYTTADPAETIRNISEALNGQVQEVAVMQWDTVRGYQGMNAKGTALKDAILEGGMNITNPVESLAAIYTYLSGDKARVKSFQRALFFWHNSHAFLNGRDIAFIQAVWNLRDPFAAVGATLVMLAADGAVPAELRQDIVTLNDPLPTPAQIALMVTSIAEAAKKGGAKLDPEEVKQDGVIHDTLTGLSGFGVKQVFSMAVRIDGLDNDVLGERKRKLVEQTKGLSIWTGGESFEELGGLENLKSFLTRVMTSGTTPVRAIGFIDEIEKMFAAAGTDTSGTSQDQLGVFLREMQDNNIPGVILIGPPGTGKSVIAKAAGRVAKAPVISFDLGAAKDSLVGGSEARIRAMMDVFRAVAQGKGFFIATCNGIQSLPPELRRRFKLGTFFVDLPTAQEREKIWKIWVKKYGIKGKDAELPECEDWTGAEIAACCEVAFRMGTNLQAASKFIVPVAKSAGETIERLRSMASGRFISASMEGLYQHRKQAEGDQFGTGRAISFSNDK